MAEVTPKWTEEEVQSDAVSKKDLVAYLQEIASVKVSPHKPQFFSFFNIISGQ